MNTSIDALALATADRLPCEIDRPHRRGPVCAACASGAHDEPGTPAGPCSCSCHEGRQ